MQKLWVIILIVFTAISRADKAPASFQIDPSRLEERYLELAKAYLSASSADEIRSKVIGGDSQEFEEFFNGLRRAEVGEPKQGEKRIRTNKALILSRDLNQYALVGVKWLNGATGNIFMLWDDDEAEPKLDWKATHVYCEMAWKEFIENKPQIPIQMRVKLQVDNYYNFSFNDDTYWLCLQLFHKDLDQTMFAYLGRDHPDFKAIVDHFTNNKECYFTVTLAYPEGATVKNQVELISLLSDTWHYEE